MYTVLVVTKDGKAVRHTDVEELSLHKGLHLWKSSGETVEIPATEVKEIEIKHSK